jgi:colanic acid biosynthesis protein WcaH
MVEFIDLIEATPLVSVDLIVQNIKNEVLLGKRLNRPAQGFWFVPGGRIQKNESITQAIARVSKTELGFKLNKDNGRLLGAYDHIYPDNYLNKQGINTHYVALGYQFKLENIPEIMTDDQHSEVIWLSVQQLLNHSEVHFNTKAYFLLDD